MAGFPKVSRGQPYDGFPAEVYNAMIDVINAYRKGELTVRSRNNDTFKSAGVKRLVNDTGVNLPRWSVVDVSTGPVVTPATDEDYWASEVRLKARAPKLDTGSKFGIYQVPCEKGLSERAVVAGCTWAKIDVSDETHGFVETRDGNTDRLFSVPWGPAEIIWKESTQGPMKALIRFVGPTQMAWVKISGGGVDCDNEEPTDCIFDGRRLNTDLADPCAPFTDFDECWIIAADKCGEIKTLKHGQPYLGMLLADTFNHNDKDRPLYSIQPHVGWTRVNKDDENLDFLEDQNQDHDLDASPTTGDVVVKSTTVVDGTDQKMKYWTPFPGFDLNEIQFVGHQKTSTNIGYNTPGKLDVVVGLRMGSGGGVECQLARVSIFESEDLGWHACLPTTDCP